MKKVLDHLAIAGLFALGGCSPASNEPTVPDGAADSGEATSGPAGTGGEGGGGGANVGGSNAGGAGPGAGTGGDPAGTGGQGGGGANVGGSNAGGAGPGAGTGGTKSDSGLGGFAGSTMDAGRASDAATVDAGLPGVFAKRDDMPQPTSDAITYLSSASWTGDIQLSAALFEMHVDAAGNIVTGGQQGRLTGHIAKFGPAFNQLWDIPIQPTIGANIVTSALTGDNAGNTYITGTVSAALPGETLAGSSDVFVGKYDPDGTALWFHQYGGAGGETGQWIGVEPDGSLVVFGDATNQLPGQPAQASGKPFLLRYAADGTRLSATQPTHGLPVNQLAGLTYAGMAALDSDGNLYGSFVSNLLFKTAPNDTDLWVWNESGSNSASVSKAAGGGFVFLTTSGFVAAVDASTGKNLWSRVWAPARTAVIEPVEGVTWTGQVTNSSTFSGGIVATANAFYLTGTCSNTYRFGSVVRPTTQPAFVARYDLEGNQVWIKEFLPAVHDAGNQSVITSLMGLELALDPQGNVIVASEPYGGLVLWRVSAADGSLL